ncbi:MAG: phosphoenolpyruvate-protein phosphotransferase system enzyme [Gemmatimonadales bacterium]|jgi:phosphoenolpyruvate-protein phosphotransferase (PTS system enzyme I)|nr:phosphoenolpyruvate-protein phosphotransferase system enzyme [Gemmatimonadales bacterium]
MNGPRQLRGIGVSPGVAWAPALVMRWDFPQVPDRTVAAGEIEGEVRRLREAVGYVVSHLQGLGERVLQRAGPEESRIFDAQILMAQDEEFLKSVETLIRKNQFSAETAYEFRALELRQHWSGAARLRDRLADLHAIQMRMIQRLLGRSDSELWSIPADEQVIVVAHELSPGLTVQLDREHVVGLVSEEGTRTAHAAILAHSLNIPAVFGVAGALAAIPDGTLLLIDGQSGTIVLNPNRDEMEDARVQVSRRQRLELQLEGVVGQPAVTPAGRAITLMGNVDLPEEIEAAVRHGAQGVGLLRTEFLITGRAVLPSEDEQTDYFRRVARAFPDLTVIIRSFDLGGDKFPAAFKAPTEANPFLGWRSIRVCLDEPEVFRPQIRAVLRAAAGHDIQLMLPLVTTVQEVQEARDIVAEEARALAAAGVQAAPSVPVGVMIETPAAVLMADRLAEVSAFFSVGTNDLTQYTMAVDRGNARLANRFNPHDPSIVRQLHRVVEVGKTAGLPVSVCGEMASEPLSAVLLLGLGYDRLSVSPPALPLVKWVIRTVPEESSRRAASAALAAASAADVSRVLREVVGEYIDVRLLDPQSALPGRGRVASLPPGKSV